MKKWEEGILHFTQQADVLLVQSSNVTICALTARSSLPYSWHQRGTQWHCIMVCIFSAAC